MLFLAGFVVPLHEGLTAKKGHNGVKKLTTLKIAWLFSCLLVSWGTGSHCRHYGGVAQ